MKNILLLLIFIGGLYVGFIRTNSVAYSHTVKILSSTLGPKEDFKITDKTVVDEVYRVFSQSGTKVALEALNCFYSESKLKPFALNTKNKNKTLDAGIAQINDIHGMTLPERFDYKKNIAKAYTIYLRNGWKSWYASGCR